jgi:hypothetical protein
VKGAESVFFSESRVGHYEYWAQNYSGEKAVRVTLEIADGTARPPKFAYLPATAGAESQHFTHDVAAR